MKFELISVARDDLEICVEFFATKREAVDAMVKSIIELTSYASLDEILRDAEEDLCGYSEDEAWADSRVGTISWKIVELPSA